MKRKSILLVFFVIITGCSTAVIIDRDGIMRDMNSVAESLGNDRSFIYSLKNRRVGLSGYYYILDLNGRVVFHPQAVLIGSDMNSYDFVKEIISKGEGCISYDFLQSRLIVFFRRINESEILCLSIKSGEMSGSWGNCTEVRFREE